MNQEDVLKSDIEIERNELISKFKNDYGKLAEDIDNSIKYLNLSNESSNIEYKNINE